MKTILLIVVVIVCGAYIEQNTSWLDFNFKSFEKKETFDGVAMSAGLYQSQMMHPSKDEVSTKLSGMATQIFKKILVPLGALALLLWSFMILGILDSVKNA